MKTVGWAVVKSYWVGFATEAGLDTGPDEWRLPPGQVELVRTGGGACGKPGGAGLVALSSRIGFCYRPDRDGASIWAELWGALAWGGACPSGGGGSRHRAGLCRGSGGGGACRWAGPATAPLRRSPAGPEVPASPWGFASRAPRSPHRHPRAR